MCAVAAIYRIVFLLSYGNFQELSDYTKDLFVAFIQGTRFDILVNLYLIFPLVLFAVLGLIFKTKPFYKLARIWSIIALILLSGLLIGDFYYYRFFGTHYSIIVFGLVDDDTTAVLKSITTDYPVIRVTLFLIALSFLYWFTVKKIYQWRFLIKLSTYRRNLILAVTILALGFIGMRGRLGLFPLRREDAYLSKNEFVNTLTLNGIFALKDAAKDYSENKIDVDVSKFLAKEGFSSAAQMVSAYTGIPESPEMQNDPLSFLRCTTPTDSLLAANPPHIVVFQMESMGTNVMDMQSSTCDILGSLKDELPHCIRFDNFFSSYDGTIFSLESILTATSIVPISKTIYASVPLPTSATWPFKHAGYKTYFVTGAKKAWRNLDVYLPAQGFDVYEGRETIAHDIPTAVEEEWGLFDEFMFDQAWNHLSAAKQPLFIYGMTITNHTPFELPKNYKVQNITISEEVEKRLLVSKNLAYDNLTTFQYACNCLGNFIRKVRESPLADRVIVVATGDHHNRGFLQATDDDFIGKYGVPLIMYIPDRYIQNKTIDTARWGSHKDIFPTIFNLALSGATYYKTGDDLFTKDYNGFALHFSPTFFSAENGKASVSLPEKSKVVPNGNPNDYELSRKAWLWSICSKYLIMDALNKK